MNKHDVLMVLLGSLTPFALVFTIRAVKLIPGVVRDTLSAMLRLVTNKPIAHTA